MKGTAVPAAAKRWGRRMFDWRGRPPPSPRDKCLRRLNGRGGRVLCRRGDSACGALSECGRGNPQRKVAG